MKNLLYRLLRISNDVNAVKRGKVGERIVRKQAHKATSKALRKLFK